MLCVCVCGVWVITCSNMGRMMKENNGKRRGNVEKEQDKILWCDNQDVSGAHLRKIIEASVLMSNPI